MGREEGGEGRDGMGEVVLGLMGRGERGLGLLTVR